MHHAGDIVPPRCLEDVQRSLDIGAHIASRGFVRIWDGNQRREVQHYLVSFNESVYEIAVLDIPADQLNRIEGLPMQVGEITDERAGIVSDHGSHRRSRRHESLNKVAANEAASAGHNDFTTCPHDKLSQLVYFSIRSSILPRRSKC